MSILFIMYTGPSQAWRADNRALTDPIVKKCFYLTSSLNHTHTHTLIWLDGWMRTPCEGMSEWSLWCRRCRRCVSSVIKVPSSSASGFHCLSFITISKIITIIIILSVPAIIPALSSFPTWSLLSSSSSEFASPASSGSCRFKDMRGTDGR